MDTKKYAEKLKDTRILLLVIIGMVIMLASVLMIIGMVAKFKIGFGMKSTVGDQLNYLNINLFDYYRMSKEVSIISRAPQMDLVNTAIAGFSFFIIAIALIIVELIVVFGDKLKAIIDKTQK